MIVDIPEKDIEIEFPDDMDHNEIVSIIQRDIYGQKKAVGPPPAKTEPAIDPRTERMERLKKYQDQFLNRVREYSPEAGSGGAEAMAGLVTGAVSFPASGIAGLTALGLGKGLDEANRALEDVQSFGSQFIDNEEDIRFLETVMKPFEWAHKAAQFTGKTAEEWSGSSEQAGLVGATVATAVEAAFLLAPAPLAGRLKKSIKIRDKVAVKKTIDKIFEKAKAVESENIKPNKPVIKDEPIVNIESVENLFGKDVNEVVNKISQKGEVSFGPSKDKKSYQFKDKETEQRFSTARGVEKPSFGETIKETFVSLKNKATREIEHLPKNKEFAELSFALRKLAHQKGVASDRTYRAIRGITLKLDKGSYDLFNRKVVLDDLASSGGDLPFGFKRKTLSAELERIDAKISDNPNVVDALAKRQAFWSALRKDYVSAMKEIGLDVHKRLSNDAYFRRQVLDYVELNGLFGTGKKLKTPSNRGFLKKRQGSTKDFNTEYVQVEHEVMAQMLHDIEIAKTIKSIDTNYNIADQVRKDAKAKNIDFEKAIPEGYTTWQPQEGNVFYMADSIPAQLAEQLTSGALKELGVKAADLSKVLAVGGKRKQFVVKNEVAATLNELVKTKSQSAFLNARKSILKGWKVWQLISPRRWFKYNARNLTGDADAMFAGNPSAFKKIPEVVNELYQVYGRSGAVSPELRRWFERGGMESTLQAQEMGEIKNLKMFAKLYETRGKVSNIPTKVWQKYWRSARLSTDFREAILRYAAYKDYLSQMKSSHNGTPKNFGASIPEEVMGLKNINDRAFMLSNDLLGAYDRVSVMGQAMREHIFPFWSWKEVNAKRYYRLFKNAADNGEFAQSVGRKALGSLAKTPYTAYRVGKFLIKATAFWSFLQVWNNTKYPELEARLPKSVRERPHIVLGEDEDGNIQYFSRIGALGDLLENFGLDTAPQYINDWFAGKMSLSDIGKEMAKSPANIMVQGSFPFVKLAFETATRRGLFPDVFNPKTIRDRLQHFAGAFGLRNEYDAIAKKPSRGYGESLEGLAIYKVDPGQAAYSDIYSEKSSFLKQKGTLGEGFFLTPQGNALYNYRLALRYGDKEAAKNSFMEYTNLYLKTHGGGTVDDVIKNVNRSIERMQPLSGMDEKTALEFLVWLGDDGRKRLVQAQKFYLEMLAGGKRVNDN
jgi:hypothetical protein